MHPKISHLVYETRDAKMTILKKKFPKIGGLSGLKE